MKSNKDTVSEMEELLSQLKGFKNIYDSCEIKTEQFLSNYVLTTDIIKNNLMKLAMTLPTDRSTT